MKQNAIVVVAFLLESGKSIADSSGDDAPRNRTTNHGRCNFFVRSVDG